MITLHSIKNTPAIQLRRSNNAWTSAKHGNSTAAGIGNGVRIIQDIYVDLEETKPWNFSEITTTLAPLQHAENA